MNIIPITRPSFNRQDEDYLLDAFRSGFASGDGPDCRLFEKEIREYLGVKHCFFTTSCTAALDLAYMVKQFPAGGEVLVPDFTFTSTALAPLINNLKVVLVDVNKWNGNMDFADAEKRITKNTVAISPVDYAGNPVEIEKMTAFARKHGLYVVHDSAQSFGATYNGQRIGSFADVTCFSFHGTKNLVVGEGGALVTNDDEVATRVLTARDKGTDKHTYIANPAKKGFYEYVSKGNSYVQSNFLAAIGRSQLRKFPKLQERRQEIARAYNEAFGSIPEVKTPLVTTGAETNWHLYYLLVPAGWRIKLIEKIRSYGVTANIHYSPLHINAFYSKTAENSGEAFPQADEFFRNLIRIPMFPDLTDADVQQVINAVKNSITEISKA